MLALRGNQGQLYEDIQFFFDYAYAGFGTVQVDTHETLDTDHGRVVTRRHWVTDALEGLLTTTSGQVFKVPGWSKVSVKSTARQALNGATTLLV